MLASIFHDCSPCDEHLDTSTTEPQPQGAGSAVLRSKSRSPFVRGSRSCRVLRALMVIEGPRAGIRTHRTEDCGHGRSELAVGLRARPDRCRGCDRHDIRLDTRTKQRIADERRRQFELDVLRDLLAAIDDGTAITTDQRSRLSIFGADEFPGWRAFAFRIGLSNASAPWAVAKGVLQEMFERYADGPDQAPVIEDAWLAELGRLLLSEVGEAIDRRLVATPE